MEEDEKEAVVTPTRKTVLWVYNPASWGIIYPLLCDIIADHNIIPVGAPDVAFCVCRMHKDIDCIVMPGSGWVETLVALRKQKAWTPIVIFEVVTDENAKAFYMRSGASFQCDHLSNLRAYLAAASKDSQLPPVFTLPIPTTPKGPCHVMWPRTGDRVLSSATDIGYIIGEKLGEGSFGAVYRCLDDFGQRFVIKVLKIQKSKEETQQDWEKESRFLLSLRHPNIIELYDVFEFNSLFYMVMEEADGSLKQLVLRGGPLPVDQVVAIAGQLLSGLHHIHGRGVIHRDLQIDNVLYKYILGKEGSLILQAKISDFGISKFQPTSVGDEGLRAYTSVGRDYDVAPELLTQGYTTHQSDIYQLGLVLYFLYQGTPALGPKDGRSSDAIINGVARYRAESIGSPLGNVIAKMLRRRAEWRFKNSGEIWAELNGAARMHAQDSAARAQLTATPPRGSPMMSPKGSPVSGHSPQQQRRLPNPPQQSQQLAQQDQQQPASPCLSIHVPQPGHQSWDSPNPLDSSWDSQSQGWTAQSPQQPRPHSAPVNWEPPQQQQQATPSSADYSRFAQPAQQAQPQPASAPQLSEKQQQPQQATPSSTESSSPFSQPPQMNEF